MSGRNKSLALHHPVPLRRVYLRPILCYVTDRRSLSNAETPAPLQDPDAIAALAQKIEAYAAAGIDWIQIREKDLPDNELTALTSKAMDSRVGSLQEQIAS